MDTVPVRTGGRAASRIAVVTERYGNVVSPCASIRLVPFFEALRERGLADVHYAIPAELRRLAPDIVAWHRVAAMTPQDLAFLESAATAGAQLVYDLDDNLLDLGGHAEADVYRGMVSAVQASLAIADQVWVSTPRLQDRALAAGARAVETMPNVLDPSLWGAPPSPAPAAGPSQLKRPLRILYMGTRTHDQDLQFLVDALDRVAGARPGAFTLTIVGVNSSPAAGRDWINYVNPTADIGASYPAFVAWFRELRGFDLGVAPLVASRFNDCKSHIKVLDYAAIGLPTLASDVPAYSDALQNGIDCVLARNDAGAWASCLIAAMDNLQPMRMVRNNAKLLVGPAPFETAVNGRARSLGVT